MNPNDFESVGDGPLVTAIGRFSEAALSEAYQRHSGAVHGLARRLLRDETLAEEITQEVFIRLWKNPEKFDAERGSLRSFLLAHTHGRSIDLIRAESSRRRREDNDALLAVNDEKSVEEEVWEMALADKIKEALSALDESERRPIELAYFGGHTYREVAKMVGQAEGTTKSRIRSGMKKLRPLLIADGLELS